MKYFYKILLSLAILLLCQTPVLAQGAITDWYIKDLQTQIIVNNDSSLDITENILADCGNLPDKHGIFRVLPKNYKTVNGDFVLPINLVSITGKDGEPIKYSVSSDANTITYKIGDPNISVIGENFYQIKYHVKNAVRTENKNFDELYWNVLGNYWDLEIDNFSAQIVFPNEIGKNNTQVSYYTGTLNSKNSNLAVYDWTSDNVLSVQSNQALIKGEGITISAAFPKNIIKAYQLTFKDKYGFSIGDIFLSLLFPILTWIMCFLFWKGSQNNFDSNKTVVPEFEIPENLTPIEMGSIIKKGQLNKNSIAATIIHLGVLGYLKIEKVEKKILFVDTSEFKIINTGKLASADLNELEKYILATILGSTKEVNLKNIGLTISSKFMEISKKLLDNLISQELINKNLKQGRELMMFGSIFLFVALIAFAFNSFSPIILGLLVSAVIVFGFSLAIKDLTLKGAELEWRIKGFKLYMETAEKYRSRFQEQNNILDKLLPYAILFGITREWLNKLKDIYGEEYMNNYSPSFMVGNYGLIGFSGLVDTITSVSNDISNGVASAISNNTSSSSSGFGGGGGAGGGGGGGGGGGW